MTSQQTANKDELSFGIELEFLFYFLDPEQVALLEADGVTPDPDALTVDADEEARLPPPLILPEGIKFDNEYHDFDDYQDPPRDWAVSLIQQAILSVRGARLDNQPMPAGTPESYGSLYVMSDHMDSHSGWTIKNDITVQDKDMKIRGYSCLSFEITSPALWDRPESHRQVYLVLQEFLKRFRLRVNIHTGFHCHVGAGVETDEEEDEEQQQKAKTTLMPGYGVPEGRGAKHSLGVFKRAAALMWAADGFLCHAHPPERGLNVYSPPIRFCSRLSRGLQTRYVQSESGWEADIKEFPLGDATVGASSVAESADLLLPEQDLPSHKFPRVDDRRFPVERPEKADDEACKRFEAMSDRQSITSINDLSNKTVYGGVGHIMRCKSRPEVAQLFAPPNATAYYNRPNYNLRDYLGGDFDSASLGTGTVEFREATGTMSPEWVSAWSNICLGFFRFARDASDARFNAVVAQLAKAEAAAQGRTTTTTTPRDSEHRYDMISLLFDMGLFAEGLFLERKLRKDALRFWYPNRLGKRKTNAGTEVEEGGEPYETHWQTNRGADDDESIPSVESSPFLQSPTEWFEASGSAAAALQSSYQGGPSG
ncbi:hypothetical protein C8A00DRAFT_29192 [Chaetomidium leptoderma]|uniref:Uncharacterized protein n=1 Tax=Chaetomidium leptoderma TaxID=669021 RepID=A0AAN7A0Q8_9PEZI|nr:hypothetical protein C8A00DRAFT_29192 [Chaetomidium leptoderma]